MKILKKSLLLPITCLTLLAAGGCNHRLKSYELTDATAEESSEDRHTEFGNAEMEFNFGNAYYYGIGFKEDHSEGVRWYRKAAEQGHAEAQLRLGIAYTLGKGVKEDKSKTVYWLRKAAEQGHVDAQLFLGAFYNLGNGVEKNEREGVRWYRKAAEQGHAKAQYALGVSYYRGEGITKNKSEGVRWYRKAAEQGDADAQFRLGGVYFLGDGIEENKSEATRWIRKAAEQGHSQAQFTLGSFYDLEKNKHEAFYWHLKAAEQGHVEAQFFVGNAYYFSEGVTQDNSEAVRWTRKAAEQGHPEAQFNLGTFYLLGKGVAESEYETYIWHLIAKDNGESRAIETMQHTPWHIFLTEAEIISAELEAARRSAEIKKRQEQSQSTDNSLSADVEFAVAKPPSEINVAAKVFENTWRSVVMIEDSEGQGSGVVIRPNLVATACHVVNGGDIVIYKPDNKRIDTNVSFHATIYHRDDARDFCILEVDGLWSIPATIRKYDTLHIGENVYAVGAPQGLDMSLSDGLVSQLRNTEDGRVIQTNAAISPGSSGGGLFDTEGNLIGIVTSKRIDENTDGIAFAIPADLALEI